MPISNMTHWYNLHCHKCIKVHNYAERAVIKLMHAQLQSCTMNANDAYIVKIVVVQSQNHYNLDRQTGRLLTMPVKTSAHAAQTWHVHTELQRCLNVERSRTRRSNPSSAEIS